MRHPKLSTLVHPKTLGVAISMLLMLVASACSEGTKESSDTSGLTPLAPECTDESVVACSFEGTTVDHLMPDAPITADGEPIKIGMMNTDSGPATAYPELTKGAETGVRWINAELGGVDNRPIELVTCDVEFSGTGSQACGQQMVTEGVVAVMGGIDVFGDGIQVLEDNGIPLIGGVPVSFPAVDSPISFQFSGGSWGQDLGLVYHITKELDAERVSIVYADFGSVADGAEWAKRALIGQGIAEEDVNMVPIPIVAEDMLTPLTAANESDPDAIIILGTDPGCSSSYQAVLDIGITAQTYWSGACIEPTMVDLIGAENLEGYIYAIESPIDVDNPELRLYDEVVEQYGNDEFNAGSVATVSFKTLMNLYAAMDKIGADNISSESIIDFFRSSVDEPSFLGHPYTCDGQQMGGELPAICSPQQILVRMKGGELDVFTDWIQVADLVQPEE
jgi:branched-chain amino acid transport system substrate-binding protein